MSKPIDQLYVEIFDWPDRFLVECDSEDREYERAFPEATEYEPFNPPYLVDLSEFDRGWCGCTAFRVHILPRAERGDTSGYLECKHLIAARDYRRKILNAIGNIRPSKAPELNFHEPRTIVDDDSKHSI